jgi:hypothetical protein
MRTFALFLMTAAAWGQRCEPPPRVAELVRGLADDTGVRQKRLGELAEANPDEFSLQRLFLEGPVYEKRTIRERYRARFEAQGSVENRFLYARSLVGFDTKEALRLYGEILAKDPENPWVHYSQLEIFRSDAFRDRAKLRASFDAVTRACPAWVSRTDT